jgi:hypothetical protein
MLQPDVTRHSRGCQQQRCERGEKGNHEPAHEKQTKSEYQTSR